MNAEKLRVAAAALLGLVITVFCSAAHAEAWIQLVGPAQTSYMAPATYQLQLSSGVIGTGPKAEYLSDIKLTRNGQVISRLPSGTYTENGISPGTYQYVYRAVAVRNVNGDEFTRQLTSPVVTITVEAPPAPFDGAEYVSASWPRSADRGTPFSGTVTFRNTGNTTWRAGEGYRLGQAERYASSAVRLGIAEVAVPHDVGPGGTATFSFSGTAAAQNGPTTLQWQMNRNGVRFGGTSSEQTFETTGRLNNGVMSGQDVPISMEAGRTYRVKLNFVNTGNTTWTASAGYALGSWNPNDNMRWSKHRVPVPKDVSPQMAAFFEFDVVAPSLPGTYSFQWHMLEEGKEWFGRESDNVQVTVTGPPSKVIGNIDAVTSDGQIRGWACSTGIESSIDLHVYTGGAAGSGGTIFLTGKANQASEPAVATACKAGGNHRFSLAMSNENRRQRAGQSIHVHGISPVGQPNYTIGGSGAFVVPAAPSGTVSVAPAMCEIASGAQTCNVTLAWSATDSRAELRRDGGAIVGSGGSGSVVVPISSGANQFTLSVAGDVIASVLATAKGAPIAPVDPGNPAPTVIRRYVYDDNLRLCKAIEPETGSTVFDYDDAGNLASSAQGLDLPDSSSCDREAALASSRRVVHSYDGLNRPIQTRHPDGLGDLQVQYTADGKVKSEAALNQDGVTVTTTLAYNTLGQVTSHTRVVGAASPRTLTFGYDSLGYQTRVGYPGGYSVQQTLNALGQPTKLQDGNGTLLAGSISYTPSGTVANMVYGNGVVRKVQENTRRRVSKIQDGPALDLSYVYDGAGNIVAIEDGARGEVGRVSLAYDRLDRLIQANASAYGGTGKYSFSYDTLDNIVAMRLPGKRERSFHYDGRNRLELLRDSQGNGVSGFAYDVAGNLNTRNGVAFKFDVAGRLRSAGASQKYFYDGSGYRAVAEGNARSSWQYMPDGQLLESTRADKTSDYIYLGNRLIAIRTNSPSGAKMTYLHHDAMNTLVATSDASGAVISRHFWSPYGEPDVAPDTSIPGYSGHLSDADVGLIYMGQRFYDPELGRFISSDPDAVNLNEASNFNRYRYANDNPFRYRDPDGRQALPMPLPVPLPPPTPILPSDGPAETAPQIVDLAPVLVQGVQSRQQEKTFVTYTMSRMESVRTITYVGRASGYGSPEQVMMQRYARHWLRRLEGYGNPKLDKSGRGESGRLAIRGREQQMIDYKGGVGSEKVGNIIRGVAKSNPAGPIYHEASNAMFGEINSYTGYHLIDFGE